MKRYLIKNLKDGTWALKRNSQRHREMAWVKDVTRATIFNPQGLGANKHHYTGFNVEIIEVKLDYLSNSYNNKIFILSLYGEEKEVLYIFNTPTEALKYALSEKHKLLQSQYFNIIVRIINKTEFDYNNQFVANIFSESIKNNINYAGYPELKNV